MIFAPRIFEMLDSVEETGEFLKKTPMKLRKDYIESLSQRLGQRLVQKGCIKVHADLKLLHTRISNTIIQDLKVEDDLDEEVRQILAGYAQQMRQQNIEYHEMFQMVKRKLTKERNLIL